MSKTTYTMRARVWLYPGATGWHFITLRKYESEEIKKRFGAKSRGWGSIPILATIGKTRWNTSLFPDRKAGAYLLPLKKDVRKKEGIENGDTVTLSVEIKT